MKNGGSKPRARKAVSRNANVRSAASGSAGVSSRRNRPSANTNRQQTKPVSRRSNTNRSSKSTGAGYHAKPSLRRGAHRTTANDIGQQMMADGVWTKGPSKASSGQKRSVSSHSNNSSKRRSVFAFIVDCLKSLVGIIVTFFVKHRIARIVISAFLLVAILFGADTVMNFGKIYPGVSVGSVDLGGMTVQEATEALENQYRDHVNNNVTVFFADEEARQNATDEDFNQDLQEQISYEQSLATRRQWTTSPSELGGAFSSGDFAQKAFEVGRSDGGIFKRLECLITGVHEEPSMTFDDGAVDDLAHSITSSLGTFRENSSVQIEDSHAYATEGHDGNEVTHDWLVNQLNSSIFGDNDRNEIIVELQYMPMQISLEQAQHTADIINNSTSSGAQFTYEGNSWDASQADVLSMVTTETNQQSDGTYSLEPKIDGDKAKSTLLSHLPSSVNLDDLQVSFKKDNDNNVTVTSNATGTIPEISQCVSAMNDSFFVEDERADAPSIDVPSTDIPETLSFEDALSYGIVEEVSSYTTEYAEGVEARNFNIHLMADRLSYSIVPANGGTWSFIDTSGPISEENGYKNAGAILAGEYSDAIGGGVCQVATTVFNSIYEAGYPILERHNHSLYIASYPEGRDAAITDSEPSLDLRWENDSTSDVLLVMSYTDSSVTATLYGVDPGYVVSTETGEWEEGDTYTTRYVTDDSLSPGDEVIQQYGADGRSISVTRTVTDTDGKVLRQDLFSSIYSAKDEIIARGPSE